MEDQQSASLSIGPTPKVSLYDYFRNTLKPEFMPVFVPGYGYEEEWALFGNNIITKYSLGARITGDATMWYNQRDRIKRLLRWTCHNIFGYNLVFSKASTLNIYLQVFATMLDKLDFLTEDEKDEILETVTLMFYNRRKAAIDYYFIVGQGLPF